MGKEEIKVKTDIKDEDELYEIYKVQDYFSTDEQVLLVAKQSKLKPGGALISGGNTIYATNKKILIKNPTMLGLRESIEEIQYDKITSVKLEKGMFSSTIVIRSPGLSELNRLSKSSGLIAWGRGEEGQIDALPKKKAEELVEIIRRHMELSKNSSKNTSNDEEPLKILKMRYAKGEITKEEFDKIKEDLL
ncbi:MAG: PH domain-containing protein [Nitrosarchaeum sp.]